MDKKELEELLIRIALCVYGKPRDELTTAGKRIADILIDAKILFVGEHEDLAHA